MLGKIRRWPARGVFVAISAVVATVLMAGVASAVPIDDVVLDGAGPTEWDPEDRDVTSCLADQRDGFTPVNDGNFDGNSDAFDDGLILSVNRVAFRDPDNNGQLSGEQLKVGPGSTAGVRVTRTEKALQGSPTLRSLIALQNRRDSGRGVRIQWDSNLGSDGSEEVRGSSNGNTTAETSDRWIVTSDNAADPTGDPPLVFALWGPGARSKTGKIIQAPGDGCFTIQMRARIPANSTRYLLFFTEMTDDSNATALLSAQKFDNVGPNSPLLNGVGPSVRDRILNWNL
jgi:hypothetical protein